MPMDYEVTIKETSTELSARDRIKMKDFTNCVQLDEACANGSIVITPKAFAILDVHNEKSKEDKDYTKIVLIDSDGKKYITGSSSFFKSLKQIWDEMGDEEFQIEVYKVPSKNYKGKFFLSCSLV